MVDDAWQALADPFVDGAYATVKGQVRTYVLHQQLLRHLPPPPATVLDVGGGAGHQSLPLARLGYDVTILDNLLGRYQTRTRTFFKAIQRVAPGQFVCCRPSRQEAFPYARPPEARVRGQSLAEYADAFRLELREAVAERLPATGRTVCQVSGGLDSSSVAM